MACVVSILAAGAAAQAPEPQPQETAEPELGIATAPVELDGHVLFRVRGASAYPAERRAALIARQIQEVARDESIKLSDIHVEESGGITDVRARDRFLVRVLDADARLEGLNRGELALVYVQVLGPAIEEYRKERTPERLWSATGRTLLATALLGGLTILLLRVFRRVDDAILRRYQHHIESLEERSFDIVRAERIEGLLRASFRTARALLLLGAFYLYLDYTLGLFPWSRPIAVQLSDWIVAPLRAMGSAFVADIPDLIFLAVLVVVVRYALKVLKLFFDGISRGQIRFEGFDADWGEPTYKIVRGAVIAFALVVAYPYIPGSSSAAFKGVSLFAGVVFSLGSSSIISNMIAGFSMTYRRAFKLGDRVKIGSTIGDVTAIRLQVTHLKTPKNEEVVVPNSLILAAEVTNYTALARSEGLILHTSVGIGYEVPWRQVEAMLLQAAERTAGIEKQPAPFVLQTALGDFAISYELNVYCRDAKSMNRLYAELHRNIQDAFNEHGVQIMTPNYVADTAQPKLVPREQWFAPPAKPDSGSS